MTFDLDAPCGRTFKFRDLIECGDTFAHLDEVYSTGGLPQRLHNLPADPASWRALEALATNVLDPLVEHFGRPTITYGFASWELQREIRRRAQREGRPARICTHRDQHAAHEARAGRRISPRDGAAVDLRIEGVSSHALAAWLVRTGRVDRAYLYGPERPLHVSWSSSPSGEVFEMVQTVSVARIPRRWSP